MLPTIRSILELTILQAAAPSVLGGAAALDSAVRWVHVSELLDVTDLLSGGELVLTTGLELEKDPNLATEYLSSLAHAGAAGLIVELVGDRTRSLVALRDAAEDSKFPVIVLEHRVRFIAITETVHRMIVAEQLEQVERSRDIHEAFTQLSLDSAGTQEVVEQAAAMIGAPVVLEDLHHLALAHAAQGVSTSVLLQDWERRSRTTPSHPGSGGAGPEQWLQVPVGVRNQLWGRLVVPMPPVDVTVALMVLERAAQTLAINRLAERDQRELSQQAQAGLFNMLRNPRGLSEAEAVARAASLGLKRSPFYVPVAFRAAQFGTDRSAKAKVQRDPLAAQQAERALLELLALSVKSMSGSALTASIQAGSVGMILALPASQLEDATLERLAQSVAAHAGEGSTVWTLGVGRLRGTLLDAAGGIDEAAHVAETAATLPDPARLFYRSTDVRLRGLLALLRDDPRVQQFAESELAGILEAEAQGRTGLLDLLGRYLESGGNKAALARSGYLSRPTLYARLAQLERLLGTGLEDAESRTSLHVALLLHRLRGDSVL
ncbi:purine catabolism regulatory protein [Arthrobacter alpinus]|uniref:Purine catabolism regulatory protein n=1 Tax=Arthrobacter alpinus TaxID=656366 RepID=A0A1H5IGY3_9MICC|nr:PucR family transcriptional regulator [Arthrobacter alpinus]SEE39469.1 purine catabolism regulatory protein [Arthrobacter alpinus]